MLTIPKTNEHSLRGKKKRRRKERHAALCCYLPSWQLGLVLIVTINRVLKKEPALLLRVKVYT